MDKYEFNIKIEQLKKCVKLGNYKDAMAIADAIDWRRVSSVSLLTTVSEVYEKNREYSEAKEILNLAYDRAPNGKRLLYKLTLLALQEGNIPEAESYYREFCETAHDDPLQNILRYQILKAKGAPPEQRIASLEAYCRTELDEHWMYELAEQYHNAGRHNDCVAMCDRIMLLFGIGPYVEAAMELKTSGEGVELNDYQKTLKDNRDRYGDTIDNYEEETEDGEYDEAIARHLDQLDGLQDAGSQKPESFPAETVDEPETEEDDEVTVVAMGALPISLDTPDELPAEAADNETAAEPEGLGEMEDEILAKTAYTVNFIVERRTPKAGLDRAIQLLRLMHQHTGSGNSVTKIKAEKLNEKGVFASADRIEGKDLIIEEAGDLTYTRIEEIMELIRREPDKRIVVLIDNPMQLKKVLSAYPELLKLFHVDREENAQKVPAADDNPAATNTDTKVMPSVKAAVAASAAAAEPAPVKAPAAPAGTYVPEEEPVRMQETPAPVQTSAPKVSVEPPRQDEMDIEEFAQYASEYARSIDCSISGKSMLALYERIEIMEEDGIPLTKENAVELIEEAADRAEKKSLGNLFSPKYDKNDMLILKEEHFIK